MSKKVLGAAVFIAAASLILFLRGYTTGPLKPEPHELSPPGPPAASAVTPSETIASPSAAVTPAAGAAAVTTVPSPAATAASVSAQLAPLLTEVRQALPKRTQLKQHRPEEMHGTPPEVVRAGDALGKLADHLAAHPEDVKAAIPVYVQCATDPEGITSVRALCYGRLQKYSSQLDSESQAAMENVPSNIKALWGQLHP